MKATAALEAGLTGAGAITVVHEFLKEIDPSAPRMDLLGMNALARSLKVPESNLYDNPKAFDLTLFGDILMNSIYYSFIGVGSKKNIPLKGAVMGAAAGVGAVLLPKPLGLDQSFSNRTNHTKILTVGLYLIGGLMAAISYQTALNKPKRTKTKKR